MKLMIQFLKSGLLLSAAFILLNSCATDPDKVLEAKAQEIAEKYIILDSHIDMPERILHQYADVTGNTENNFDFPKAITGKLNAPFMVAFVSPEFEGSEESQEVAEQEIEMIENLVKENPDKFAMAYTSEDVRNNFKNHLISLPMGLENGAPLMGDLDNLHYYYQSGIRYVTLVHGENNHICDSSYDSITKWKGLSPFGIELIAEMNKIGMMIDVSHATDSSTYAVLEASQVPIVATHSGARHFTPGFERNLSDDLIIKIAEKGGMIQVPFGSGFITLKSNEHRYAFKAALKQYMEANNFEQGGAEEAAFTASYYEEKPYPYVTIDEIIDHFDYIIKLVGVDHVGIGSDFEGVGDSLPEGLKDVSGYPNLIKGFLKRGYSEADIEKILGLNFLNYWQRVQDAATI